MIEHKAIDGEIKSFCLVDRSDLTQPYGETSLKEATEENDGE